MAYPVIKSGESKRDWLTIHHISMKVFFGMMWTRKFMQLKI